MRMLSGLEAAKQKYKDKYLKAYDVVNSIKLDLATKEKLLMMHTNDYKDLKNQNQEIIEKNKDLSEELSKREDLVH
jgi:hypothetical protein